MPGLFDSHLKYVPESVVEKVLGRETRTAARHLIQRVSSSHGLNRRGAFLVETQGEAMRPSGLFEYPGMKSKRRENRRMAKTA
ncbi:MAG TPA: hypothetical protein VN647_01165, partial [Nitrospira sp.]|nr:hypothetical protein [Nitrospira sp.]